jgi:transcriptional regulator with XRE-family HTH domain
MPNKSRRAVAFGSYLKELRDASDRPLRAVAPEIGISFPHLGRIERGDVRGPPTLLVLTRIAAVYDRPHDEVFERAGVSIEATRPDEFPSGEEQFHKLLLSPEFKPDGLKSEHIAFFAPVLRIFIRDFAANVERHTEARVRWELQGEDAGETPPGSTRTYAEVIGAATVKFVVNPDWKETD